MITAPLGHERFNPGDQIAAYTLLDRIGFGGQAVVWSAWDYRRERVVAIKIFTSLSSGSLDIEERIEREVHLVASLDHPHILPLYEADQIDEHYYYVMRYVSSGSLSDLLRQGSIPTAEVLRIAGQMASALEYIHARNIIHRDIKPGNILLDAKHNAYLGDFGLARQIEQITALLHTGRGTAPYAPPEQHVRSPITPRSDIYSLGVLLYELLTGKLPWAGDTSLALQQLYEGEQLPEISSDLYGEHAPALTEALRKLTATDPPDRPASAAEAVGLVLSALQDKGAADLPRSVQADIAESVVSGDPVIEDARALLEKSLQTWEPESTQFEPGLTQFALIDMVYSRPERYGVQPNEDACRFMLRGALAHAYHISLWWRKLPDPNARLRVCEQVLANEGEPTVARLLEQLLGEPAESFPYEQLSQPALERLAEVAAESGSAQTRRDALEVLGRAARFAARWRPFAFSPEADGRLVDLALSEEPHALEAARLIGSARSEAAARRLLAAQQNGQGLRAAIALSEMHSAAGSLPRDVPLSMRWKLTARMLRKRMLEDRGAFTWTRVLLGLAAGVLVSLGMARGLFAPINLQMRDILFQPYPVSNAITIVSIDDASLERYGRWDAWPRRRHAELIDRLKEAGARVIVMDITFASATEDDSLLAEAMQRAGNVIQPVPGEGDAYLDTPGVVRYLGGVWPEAELQAASAALGHPNVLHDADGYVRRMPTVIQIGGAYLPSIPLAAVNLMLGVDPGMVPEISGSTVRVAGREIPVGTGGELTIHYAGPPSEAGASTFTVVSVQDVLDGSADPELFRDKIVLVGIMATAVPDRYLTPVSRRGAPMYGVEILANAVETIWSGRFVRVPSIWVQVAVLLLLGVITGLIDVRPWLGLALMVGEMVLYLVIAGMLFDSRGILLSLFYPFVAIALSYTIVTAYRLSAEVRQRRQVMRLFEARVTPEVARATLRAVEQGTLNLDGEVQEVTVVFAAVRGYSQYVAAHEARAVREVLNMVMDFVAEGVFVYEGTLAHSERDQAMALFNAPMTQADHALRAVQAALEANNRLLAYHQSLPPEHPHLAIGLAFGINTGRAIVGHGRGSQRYDYTATGQPVNIAQRLVDAAEAGQIVIGAATYDRVVDFVDALPLPAIAVRDVPTPVQMFAVSQQVALPAGDTASG